MLLKVIDVVDNIDQGDSITGIEIIRIGDEAESWNAVDAFESFKKGRRTVDYRLRGNMQMQN